jgi:hypothetical protein
MRYIIFEADGSWIFEGRERKKKPAAGCTGIKPARTIQSAQSYKSAGEAAQALADYLQEPVPGSKERVTRIAFLKSRLQSESGDDARETQKEIDYYESGEDLPKP